MSRHFYIKFVKAFYNPGAAYSFIKAFCKGWLYRLKYEKVLNRATFGRRFRVNGKLIIKGPGKVVFGDDVICSGTVTPFTHKSSAQIYIGDGVFLNGTRFGAAQSIWVGAKCILADCRIMDTDFHSLNKDRHSPEAPVGISPVCICNNVWVGAEAAILKGVTIGENSVIGFGAVVTSDISPNVIAVGNPAKAVKEVPE